MSERRIPRLGSLKDVAQFQEQVRSQQIKIPCDRQIDARRAADGARQAEAPNTACASLTRFYES